MRVRELQYATKLRSFREECAVIVQRHEQQGALLQEFAGETQRQNLGHREAAELSLTQQREFASLRVACETSLNQVHAECVAMRRRGETQRDENVSVGKTLDDNRKSVKMANVTAENAEATCENFEINVGENFWNKGPCCKTLAPQPMTESMLTGVAYSKKTSKNCANNFRILRQHLKSKVPLTSSQKNMEQIQAQVLENGATSETAETINEEIGVGQPPQNRPASLRRIPIRDQTAQSARGERYEVPHFGYLGYSRNLQTKEAEFLRIEPIPLARNFKTGNRFAR